MIFLFLESASADPEDYARDCFSDIRSLQWRYEAAHPQYASFGS